MEIDAKNVNYLIDKIRDLEDSLTSHKQRINELIDGNKCDKEELNMRIKELEEKLDDMDVLDIEDVEDITNPHEI